MQRKPLETLLYSAGGVLALGVILIAVNFLTGAFNKRVDLTDGKVYTLSDGTRAILAKLEAPVRVRFYYSRGSEAMPVGLKTFAKRVEDLLEEYRAASGGKVVIEKFNPLPDSEAEDSAALDGVEGQMTHVGERFYFGLSVSFLDQKAAIPVLSPERERLLEYDVTRAISQVAATKKPVVGVMSALPVMGRALNPLLKQQPTEPWVLGSELKRMFDVREVRTDAEKIDDDIQVLLVIHPRDIGDETEYAIDQFVLRGGKLIAFVDPYAYFDQQPDVTNPFGGSQAGQSALFNLFRAWGVDMNMHKVVSDLTFASGAGARLLPTLLSLSPEALNQDDVVTSQVGTLLIPFGGVFEVKPPEGLTKTVLAHTSRNSSLVDLIIATLSGEPSTRGFEPSGQEMPLAIRLTGQFRTAFPEGKPKPMLPRDERKEAEQKKATPEDRPHLKESEGENVVVLVADVDMLTDNAAVDVQEIFGQRLVIPRNGNLNFALSLVEHLAGDENLIGLRSRAAFTRPLTVVREMEARAQQAYLSRIKELEDSLNETQEKLKTLQKTREGPQAAILTPEQQAEIENFRRIAVDTRRDLKELRRNLRAETESLELTTKVINIALMPLLVTFAGLSLAFVKRRRVRARA
jgi:ABC-type uncharacterized transport system involved in gliding motility auxiliary subunit